MLKKILLTIVLLLITAYLLVAITAFNRKPAGATCTDIELVIKDTAYAGFVTTKEIAAILTKKKLNPVGKNMDGRPVCTSMTAVPFPGGNLDEGTLFIGTSSYSGPNARMFYTKGNEVRYIDRRNQVDRSFMTFDHAVTSLTFAAYADWMNGVAPYQQIAVGFENGDFKLVDIANPDRPQVIEDATRNVGGRVVSAVQVGVNTHVAVN